MCTGVQLTGTSAEQPDPARLGAGSMGWWRIVRVGQGTEGDGSAHLVLFGFLLPLFVTVHESDSVD